jgi:multiple sugar transport system substrate-binding protein
MAAELTGLTWDHPRGYGPLEALDRLDRPESPDRRGLTPIAWNRQPLEGFEGKPLSDLADNFDLLIIDHPHVADAVEAGALIPIDQIVSPAQLERWRKLTAGLSFESYQYQGKQWALPVDAATQVMATQVDVAPPDTWPEVLEYAHAETVALCTAGPHAFHTWMSVLVAQDALSQDHQELVSTQDGVAALEFLIELYGKSAENVMDLNPIQLLEHMAQNEAVRLCPLIYGYVNYSQTASGRNRLGFHNAPSWHTGGRRGSVLGGTGIAVTRRAKDRLGEIEPHLSRLMDPTVQATLVPDNGGQPSVRTAWNSPSVNNASGNFYNNTLETLETAWVRPRWLGWNTFQYKGSAIIRDALLHQTSAAAAVNNITIAYKEIESLKG